MGNSNPIRTLRMKNAGDSDTNAHPCRIGGADFLLMKGADDKGAHNTYKGVQI